MAAKKTRPIPPPRHRREGFAGQHLVVLPPSIVRKMEKDPLLGDLFPTATGSFPSAPGHLVHRDPGIAEHILIRVLSGRGWVRTTTRQEIPAGRFVFLPAGMPHVYGADEVDPWSIQWIHFRGRGAAAFAALFRTEPPAQPLVIPPAPAEKLDFSLLYEALETGYTPLNLMGAAAHLRMILTELHRLLQTPHPSSADEAVRVSLHWMRGHLPERVTLAELAREAGLSVPHYSAVFKRVTGFPPLEHFLRLKIQRACQLLDTTGLRVGEVAGALGWDDPFYFSRYFRRITGKSPRAYRQVVKS